MTRRRSSRFLLTLALTIVGLAGGASATLAQTGGTVEVTGIGAVTENPRGDSFVLGTVEPGMVLEVVDIQGPWYRVRAPEGVTEWRLGWIHERSLAVLTAPAADADQEARRLGTAIRGFGQIGAIRFTASDSFDAVTGSAWGLMWGGGAQFGFSNGLFLQGSYERFETTGQRVFVFEDEIFDLGIDNEVTVTPVQVTIGYRQPANGVAIAYLGAGLGMTRLEEHAEFSDPVEDVDETAISYHVLGGVEYPIGRWLWLGGEAQWAYVPDVLGDDGISAAFDENDLGGFTLRFKISVGR